MDPDLFDTSCPLLKSTSLLRLLLDSLCFKKLRELSHEMDILFYLEFYFMENSLLTGGPGACSSWGARHLHQLSGLRDRTHQLHFRPAQLPVRARQSGRRSLGQNRLGNRRLERTHRTGRQITLTFLIEAFATTE